MTNTDFQIERLSKQKTDFLQDKLIAIATVRDCEDIIAQAKTIVKNTRRKKRLWVNNVRLYDKWYMKTWRVIKFLTFCNVIIKKVGK